jgi:hypothetical protein
MQSSLRRVHTTPAMPFNATDILAALDAVRAERLRRRAAPELGLRIQAVKAYQQRRFAHTYADLLASARYRAAARFFLDDLYGPQDFAPRDAQLARVVPALVRLFPQAVVDVVGRVVSLHALSERLDSAMGERGAGGEAGAELDANAYVQAWQATGQAESRERQIALTLEVGAALDALVHKPLLRNSLILMRTPARLAGLSDLQEFLERGFDAFRAMHGAAEFLARVAQRERQLAAVLFQADRDAAAARAALALLPPDPPTPA